MAFCLYLCTCLVGDDWFWWLHWMKWPINFSANGQSHWNCTSLVELSCWMKVHVVGGPQMISNGYSTCYQAILNSQWVPRRIRTRKSLSCCVDSKRIARVNMNDAGEFEQCWLQYVHTIFSHRFFIVFHQQEPPWISTAKVGIYRELLRLVRALCGWCAVDGVCVCVEHCVGCVQSWLLSKLTDFDRFALCKGKKSFAPL